MKLRFELEVWSGNWSCTLKLKLNWSFKWKFEVLSWCLTLSTLRGGEGGVLRTHTFFDARLLNFSNRKGTPKLLDFSYFVITWLAKKIWPKLAHLRPNAGRLKICPPKISFVSFNDYRDLKDFRENSTEHNFFIFWARDLIFWILTHIIYALRLVKKNLEIGPIWAFPGVWVLRTPPGNYHVPIPRGR